MADSSAWFVRYVHAMRFTITDDHRAYAGDTLAGSGVLAGAEDSGVLFAVVPHAAIDWSETGGGAVVVRDVKGHCVTVDSNAAFRRRRTRRVDVLLSAADEARCRRDLALFRTEADSDEFVFVAESVGRLIHAAAACVAAGAQDVRFTPADSGPARVLDWFHSEPQGVLP